MSKRPSRRDLLSGAAVSLIATSAAGARGATADASAGAAAQGTDSSRAPDAADLAFDQGWPGRFVRSVADRLKDIVSILDFIPVTEHAALRERTSTTDVAGYFQAAIDYIASLGYGTIFIPSGRYRCGSPVTLTNDLTIIGAGKASSHIQFTHAGTDVPSGSGFRLLNSSNRSTGAYVTLEKLWFENISSDNRGACFYDRCSTFVTLRDCIFAGGRYGVIFDQTEVSGIYSCDMSGQLRGGAGLWLVNGPDITPGHLGGFTNQITIDHNCQFNQGGIGGAHAVVNDGGDCHYFGSNNINGGGMRFAGCANLTIMGGEYESVSGRPTMTFSAHTRAGNPVGGCRAIVMNGIISQPSGQPCIHIESMKSLNITGMALTASGVAGHITGAGACSYIVAHQNANANNPSVPVFDGYASSGHDEDGLTPVFTNASTGFTLPIAYYNAMVQTTAASAVTVTVPAHAELPFPIGARVLIEQNGGGPVTLRTSRGVTVDGTLSTGGRHQTLTLIKTAADRWLATRQS